MPPEEDDWFLTPKPAKNKIPTVLLFEGKES